jgi:hypothetical protein
LLCGLGVAHHALSVFFIVPFSAVLAVAAVRAGAWRPWLALLAALGIIVPLAGGALLLAGAAHPVAGQWPLAPTVNAVWRHMTGMAYRGYVGRFAPRPFERRLIVEAVIPFLVPGIAGGALFALRLGDFARRSCMLALLGGAALLVAFVVNYGVPDPSSYFAAPLLAALIFVLPLFAALARRLSRTAWLIVLCGAPLALGAWSIPDAIRADRELDRIDRRIRDAWHRVPFERGIVMWSDDHFRRLVLFQALEGDRPGPIVVDPVLLTWPVERARFERAAGFNPLMGLPLSRSQDLTRIPGNIRRLSPLPVADFPDLLERRDVTAVSGAAPSRPSP